MRHKVEVAKEVEVFSKLNLTYLDRGSLYNTMNVPFRIFEVAKPPDVGNVHYFRDQRAAI
jgi:hypothetical protein